MACPRKEEGKKGKETDGTWQAHPRLSCLTRTPFNLFCKAVACQVAALAYAPLARDHATTNEKSG